MGVRGNLLSTNIPRMASGHVVSTNIPRMASGHVALWTGGTVMEAEPQLTVTRNTVYDRCCRTQDSNGGRAPAESHEEYRV